MNFTQNLKEIEKRIRQLGGKYSTWQVFEDFLSMSAISISNAIDWTHRDEREKQYLETVKRYTKAELDLFPEMFAFLIDELERNAEQPQDVLGPIFHDLELHNKYKGQFFTPQNICDMMGMISLSEDDKAIAKDGFISVAEPCAGSGAMVLGFAKAMQNNHFDFHRNMVVTATDIDLKCVYMCYLQLSLYGIPAVVIHGNSLLLQEWSRWYTPVYMLDGWVWRRPCGNLDKRYPEDEAIKRATEPMYAAMRDAESLMPSFTNESPENVIETPQNVNKTSKIDNLVPAFDIDLSVSKGGQLSLF